MQGFNIFLISLALAISNILNYMLTRPHLTICLLFLMLAGQLFCQENKAAQKETDSVKAAQLYKLAKEYTYNDPNLSKKYIKEAIFYATKSKNPLLEGGAYNILGLCHRNLSEYDSALVAFEKTWKIFDNKNEATGYGNARNNYAMTLFYKGEYENANTMLMEVIDEADRKKLHKVLSNAYQNLGIVNTTQERYRDALENFILAEKYHELSGDVRGKAGAAINQAFIYYKHLKQYDKAIALYKEIIPLKQSLKDEKGVAISHNNLAEIYTLTNNYERALENVTKAITINTRINDPYGQTNSYYLLADIYLKQKKYTEAETNSQQSAAIAKQIGAKKEYSKALELLSKIQGENQNIGKAYDNLLESVKIKDSLLNKENFARMAELETKYETQKKEREILLQRTKIAENQIKIDQKNMQVFGAFSLAVIALLLGYVFYNRQKLKTVKLEKEAELKEALLFIETQNKLQEQRLRISRDLHDNIGSQLTFIISSLDNLNYSFDIADSGLKTKISGIRNFTKETITELRDTIWAMNKEEITLQDLSTRISNFIENAKAAFQGVRFIFEVENTFPETVAFSSIKGINIYRVIQESVNNVLKHAEATEIAVLFSGKPEGYTISITDNGKGFDTETESAGNGLDNIKKRIADSCGELAIVSSPNNGTKVIVHIK